MTHRAHALFRRYPLDGQARVSTGTVPTPYQVYDGHGLFFGGTACLAAARELLAPEQVQAVQTADGQALMGLWVFDFTDASLGAHHELQLSIFASAAEQTGAPAHRLGLIETMLTRPDVQMLCHGLWNNSPAVVAYNRELLGLDACVSDSRIERERDAIGFSIRDRQTRAPIVEGRIRQPQRASMRAGLALVARLGLLRSLALARQPWIGMRILNPVGPVLGRNAVAESYTKADVSAVRYFDPVRDRLVIADERYRRLQFRPQFCQFMDGFKFVYLAPR